MSDTDFDEYKARMLKIKQMQAAGGPAMLAKLQAEMGELQKWLQESFLTDADKATTFKQVMQEENQLLRG